MAADARGGDEGRERRGRRLEEPNQEQLRPSLSFAHSPKQSRSRPRRKRNDDVLLLR